MSQELAQNQNGNGFGPQNDFNENSKYYLLSTSPATGWQSTLDDQPSYVY